MPALRIVSGGQTGVDRAALDVAIELGFEQGGWCPRGRLSEDGPIPSHYSMTETDSSEYSVRTERNVLDSDGTLILYRRRLSGGTQLTYELTSKQNKPCLVLDLLKTPDPEQARQWIVDTEIRILNVAGPRASSSPAIYRIAHAFLKELLADYQNRATQGS